MPDHPTPPPTQDSFFSRAPIIPLLYFSVTCTPTAAVLHFEIRLASRVYNIITILSLIWLLFIIKKFLSGFLICVSEILS